MWVRARMLGDPSEAMLFDQATGEANGSSPVFFSGFSGFRLGKVSFFFFSGFSPALSALSERTKDRRRAYSRL